MAAPHDSFHVRRRVVEYRMKAIQGPQIAKGDRIEEMAAGLNTIV